MRLFKYFFKYFVKLYTNYINKYNWKKSLKIEDTFFTQYFWPENFRINELVNSYNLKIIQFLPRILIIQILKILKILKKEDQKYISSKILEYQFFLDQPVTFQFS